METIINLQNDTITAYKQINGLSVFLQTITTRLANIEEKLKKIEEKSKDENKEITNISEELLSEVKNGKTKTDN